MGKKALAVPKEQLQNLAAEYGTPFHLYLEAPMRANARALNAAFAWAPSFKEHFAVKALPNPYILKILHEEGLGTDCSSLSELILSQKAGIVGEDLFFSSNDTPAEDFLKALSLGAILNLDDIKHLSFLQALASLPPVLSFRYNPGSLYKGGNEIIGLPEQAKYGMTKPQILQALAFCHAKGIKRLGLHTMVISNELNSGFFVETAKIMFELAVTVKRQLGIEVEFLNFGGGIGIPYKPEESAIDFAMLGRQIALEYQRILLPEGLDKVGLRLECGRVISGPYGYLVAKVLHHKDTYKQYIGLDACMTDLMRPALYGAYHHITVLGKEHAIHDHVYDITGSLCENNDKFAIDRLLPEIEIGDLLVLHDTGAHGHAMGFNYNGKLRSKELLLREDGSVQQIRRAETLEDYFATLDFSGLDI
ncbi:MAG: diaminopimelate decarboxylase [Clostridiales bacterium]|nr:diaminopimelate decarboxylase [Clostridiales bacterium]